MALSLLASRCRCVVAASHDAEVQVYALLEGGVGLERDFGVVDSREVKVFDAA